LAAGFFDAALVGMVSFPYVMTCEARIPRCTRNPYVERAVKLPDIQHLYQQKIHVFVATVYQRTAVVTLRDCTRAGWSSIEHQ
jgi:hypothetical protein